MNINDHRSQPQCGGSSLQAMLVMQGMLSAWQMVTLQVT
jgi:hypothetical protein